MKKILIFSHAMELGGVELALLGLLETLDKTKYQIDLFLMRHEGELMKYIPEGIQLLPEIPEYSCLAVPITSVIKKKKVEIAIGRIYGKEKARRRALQLGLSSDNGIAIEYSHKYTKFFMPAISNEGYDLAISFLTPHYFVAEKVNAKKKIAWIHTDYSTMPVDTESELSMWMKYNRIMSISNKVTESFLKIFPTVASKICLMENILPIKYIEVLKEEFLVKGEMPDDGAVKILTIGRFSYAKRMDEIPLICSYIKSRGINLKWYLIGFGGEEQLIRKKIQEAKMEKYVIILGKKVNPYPYINACDIYAQPSRYEGKSVAVREAQMLHKPVVITDYSTSQSQLRDGYDGVIVPMELEKCADGFVSFIKNRELQHSIVENTKKNDYAYTSEIEKLYRLIDEWFYP